MPLDDSILIRPFRWADQTQTRKLILAGLKEHWGVLDPAFNHDLKNITQQYADAVFLVAEDTKAQRIVGSGALVPREPGVAEIVRMSVDKTLRRSGLGTRILQTLIDYARGLGLQRVFLETTETWHEVIAFYQRFGFQRTHTQDGDVYFAFDLRPASDAATAPPVVSVGARIQLELIEQRGGQERLTVELVVDSAADMANNLLGEGTPLARAILGRKAGDVVPYKVGEMKEVCILSIEPGQITVDDLSERRTAARDKMIKDADKTSRLIFGSAVSSKWGSYEPDQLED